MNNKYRNIFCFALTFCCSSLFLFGLENEQHYDISSVSLPIILSGKSLIEKHKKENLGIPIIAIGGCSAVGKSEFARALCHAFQEKGIRATILKQDDFMNPLETIHDYLIHPHLDYKKIYDVICCIKRGNSHINKPRFDWTQQVVIYEDLDLTNTDIILFEGLYVLCGQESYNFGRYSDMRIFINAQEEDIIEWNWQREISGKCSHTPRTREKFDQDIAWDMSDYRKNILPSKSQANFVIEKNRNHEYLIR